MVEEKFTPDRLGAPTNLSITANFSTDGAAPPSAVRKLTLYAPGGLGVDTRGTGTCTRETLEAHGPSGCPTDSRIGFGGGVGVLTLPREVVHEPFTLDFFLAPHPAGRLALLAYASGVSPIAVELVVLARQVPAPKPYGLGFMVEVPPVSTFPGAPEASVESAFATFGAANVAYFHTIHGKRALVHVKGISVPKRCPSAGFPTEGTIAFADGQALTVNPTIPCPGR